MAGMQKTILKEVSVKGVGLHTGVECEAIFKPAETNTGIRFVRTDVEDFPPLQAHIDHVVDIARGTTIARNGHRVHTVEHVLAALAGLGIDNVLVELSAKEPPVLDGSSRLFVDALRSAGLKEQRAKRRVLVIDKAVSYSNKEAEIELHVLPCPDFKITFMMDYGHISPLGRQVLTVHNVQKDFVEEISSARTFALLSEVRYLKENGLAQGGSLDNAVVFVDAPITPDEEEKVREMFDIRGPLEPGEDGIIKGQELRYQNEAVRHKILDLIGDLTLLGIPIQGHVVATRSGHGSNIELVKAIRAAYPDMMDGKDEREPDQQIFNIKDIKSILPHRYPMLLVDRIVEVDFGKSITGIKNVTINEEFFKGHFPDRPIMPAVLILEALAQAGGFMLLQTVANPQDKLIYFTSIDKARFRIPVVPGDQLELKINVLTLRRSLCKMDAKAYVDGKVAAEGILTAVIVDKET